MIDLPARAGWRHQDAPVGFEVLFLHREPDGYGFDGHATAVEGGAAWRADAPAACVRAPGLGVERLEQSYTHLEESERWLRNEYTAPSFD